jgi:protein-S-isoprenylcysteine O-methyltransferase Ste14
MLRRMIVRSIIGTALFGVVLFGPAGTLAWPQAWIFLALFIGCSAAMGIWLYRTDPGLLVERMRSPLSRQQKPADRLVVAALLVAFWGWLILAALDARRFEWSYVPVWLQLVGAILILVAFYGWVTVLRANSFASVEIRLQSERRQTVASTGPYAVVRHPMYSYAVLLMVGSALLLGSLWSLAAVPLLMLLLIARIDGEERLLRDGLPGYRDYAAKVRYRLIPGVW